MAIKLYEKFKALSTDTSWIGLSIEPDSQYFCTPINAKIIGWDNGLHYCFIEDFGEMVFCVNPETCCDYYVYPLAKNFYDFLSLIISTQNTNTMQQVILWDKQTFENFMNDTDNVEYANKIEVKNALTAISTKLGVTKMEKPFEYIKALQKEFPYDKINFSDEFYEATGLTKP